MEFLYRVRAILWTIALVTFLALSQTTHAELSAELLCRELYGEIGELAKPNQRLVSQIDSVEQHFRRQVLDELRSTLNPGDVIEFERRGRVYRAKLLTVGDDAVYVIDVNTHKPIRLDWDERLAPLFSRAEFAHHLKTVKPGDLVTYLSDGDVRLGMAQMRDGDLITLKDTVSNKLVSTRVSLTHPVLSARDVLALKEKMLKMKGDYVKYSKIRGKIQFGKVLKVTELGVILKTKDGSGFRSSEFIEWSELMP